MDNKTRNFIIGALKRQFSRAPLRKQVLTKAKHPTRKGPRGGAQFVCSSCKKVFSQNQINVDHCSPVIPVDRKASELSWDELIDRLFCDEDNLQVLCRTCHSKKTKQENKLRREYAKAKS